MFSDLFQYAMSILMFKAFHNHLPANIQNIFKIHIHDQVAGKTCFP